MNQSFSNSNTPQNGLRPGNATYQEISSDGALMCRWVQAVLASDYCAIATCD